MAISAMFEYQADNGSYSRVWLTAGDGDFSRLEGDFVVSYSNAEFGQPPSGAINVSYASLAIGGAPSSLLYGYCTTPGDDGGSSADARSVFIVELHARSGREEINVVADLVMQKNGLLLFFRNGGSTNPNLACFVRSNIAATFRRRSGLPEVAERVIPPTL